MTGAEVDTSLALALEAVFEEEQACESVEHLTRPEGHAGTAQWYVHVKHECGYDVVKAYCGKFMRVLYQPDAIAICGGCGVELPVSEVVQRITRIGA